MAKLEVLKKVQDNRFVRYFRETWFELKKVSWPNRSEAMNLTLMVIVVTVFLAIILGAMDWIFGIGVRQLL